jgi:hypothetical protein
VAYCCCVFVQFSHMGRIVPLGRVEEERVGAGVCDRSVKKMARLQKPLSTGDEAGQGPRQ